MLFLLKTRGINRLNLGVTIQFASLSSINISNEILGYISSPLRSVYRIEYVALRFHHVAHEEEASRNACHLIIFECSR